MSKSKKTILIIASVVIILGSIAYLAADRYLIKHVEIEDVLAYSTTPVAAKAIQTEESTTETVSNETETALTESGVDTITSDDWNYQSSSVSISIKEISTGSGEDTVTYFVADVAILNATQLQSAFADNQFGRNIIEYTSQIAEANNAIFAINGDYYGFRSDGIVIRNGVIYRDKPARIGLAFYLNGSMKIYDETQTSAEELLDEGVWNTLSFGPALIENNVIAENLSNVEIDTNFGNHPIQGNQPRTGVVIIDNNHFVFVVVDGRSPGYSKGVTLTEFAQIFKDLGCTDAYNIDGGGSSTMYFMGRVVNNPLGKNKERGTSDILFIG
jgi:exopolysaccharide biosynthesis protein